MGLITHPHTSHNQSNWGITRSLKREDESEPNTPRRELDLQPVQSKRAVILPKVKALRS